MDFLRTEELPVETGQVFTPEIKAEIGHTRKYMLETLAMLFAPIIMAWYFYGGRALRLMVISVLTAVLCEFIGGHLIKSLPTIRDFSAVITGLLIALCLPASVPVWVVVLASAFAILAAKLPFGNARSALFSPAAAGLAFVTICFSDYVFAYPAIPESGEQVGVYGTPTFTAGMSLSQMLLQSTSMVGDAANYLDILIGDIPGAMGTGCIIALVGALLYAAVRRRKAFGVTLAFLATCAVYAFLFPRIMTGRLQSVFMELSGGMLLFAGILILPYESMLPKRFYGRLVYGAAAGLICMLFRTFGTFEEGVVFAILIANALAGVCDKMPVSRWERKAHAKRRRLAREAQEEKEQEERRAQWLEADAAATEQDPVETTETNETPETDGNEGGGAHV